jgi:hypothetical protein
METKIGQIGNRHFHLLDRLVRVQDKRYERVGSTSPDFALTMQPYRKQTALA